MGKIKPDAGSLRMRTELVDIELAASTLSKRIQWGGGLSELTDGLRKMAATAPPEEAERLTVAADVLDGRFESDRTYRRKRHKALKNREIARRVDDFCKQGWREPDAIKIVLANSGYRSPESIYNKLGKR
jgi:hypothetical protein